MNTLKGKGNFSESQVNLNKQGTVIPKPPNSPGKSVPCHAEKEKIPQITQLSKANIIAGSILGILFVSL